MVWVLPSNGTRGCGGAANPPSRLQSCHADAGESRTSSRPATEPRDAHATPSADRGTRSMATASCSADPTSAGQVKSGGPSSCARVCEGMGGRGGDAQGEGTHGVSKEGARQAGK